VIEGRMEKGEWRRERGEGRRERECVSLGVRYGGLKPYCQSNPFIGNIQIRNYGDIFIKMEWIPVF